MFYRTNLRPYVRPSIYRHDVHAVDIFAKVFQVVGNLNAKFACRTKNNSLGGTILRVDFLQKGQSKGSRLARTRLC